MSEPTLDVPFPHASAIAALLGTLLFGMALTPPEAQSQQYRQNVRVVTEVQEGPTRAFLDSLTTRMRQRDTMMVRRSPESDDSMTVAALSDTLLDDGVGLNSANRLFIEYQWVTQDNELVETIQSFQFVFRPAGQTERDVPIMYVDAGHPLVRNVLRTSGIPFETNLQSVRYFIDVLSFPSLALEQNATLVSIAGRTLRDGYDRRRRALLGRLTKFIYDRDKVYVTASK